ncbi:hypothetical protein D9M73_221840 [compost metagenome]
MMPLDLDADKNRQPQANFIRVQLRLITTDHPGFLKVAYTPQAWRGREADLVGQLHVGQPAVALQGCQYATVIGIQFYFWHKCIAQ